MNVGLLRKIQKHIIQEPRRLDMNVIRHFVDPKGKENPPCGTVGCIAGWANVLSGNYEKFDYYIGLSEAASTLGLDLGQRERLFTEPILYNDRDIDGWPEKYAVRYLKAKTANERARATSDRIEHFIKTKGKQ